MTDPKDPKISLVRPRVARSSETSKRSEKSTAGNLPEPPIGRPMNGGDEGFTVALIQRLESMEAQFQLAKILPVGADGRPKTNRDDLQLYWFIRDEWQTPRPTFIQAMKFQAFCTDPIETPWPNHTALGVIQEIPVAGIAAFQWADEEMIEGYCSNFNRFVEPN